MLTGVLGSDLGRGGEPVRRRDGGRGGVDGGEQLGRAEGVLLQELVGGGDLDGGGVLAAEEHGLLGAAGEVAELGALHRAELQGGLGQDRLRQGLVAEVVQGASDAVGGFDQRAVGDHHRAAVRQVRFGDRVGDLAEGLAFLLSAPALAVGLQRDGGAGRVGVGAPGGVGAG